MDFNPTITKYGTRVDCSICHNFRTSREYILGCDYIKCYNCHNIICLYCGKQVNNNDGNMGSITSAHNTPGVQPTIASYNAHFGFRNSKSDYYPSGDKIPNGGWCLERAGVKSFRNEPYHGPALKDAIMDAPSGTTREPIVTDIDIGSHTTGGPAVVTHDHTQPIDLNKLAREISNEIGFDMDTIKPLLQEIILTNPDNNSTTIKGLFKSMYTTKYLSSNISNDYKTKYLKYKIKYMALKKYYH